MGPQPQLHSGGLLPWLGAKGVSRSLQGPGFPWQLCNGERKGLLQKGKQERPSIKNTVAVGCEITLSGLGAQTAPSGKQAEQRRRAQGSDFSLQPFLRF